MIIGLDIRKIGKNRTGDETVFFLLAKTLPRIDSTNEYRLLIDNRSKKEIREIENLLEIEKFSHVRIEQCGSGNKFLWNAISAPRAARRLQLDIYHTQYIVPFWMPARTKIVTHIHDVSFCAYPEYISWKDRWFLHTLIPWSIRRATTVITVSEFTKREIMKYYGTSETKIVVAPNSIDERYETQEYSNEKMAMIRKKYALSKSYILHIGTMQPRKNIPFLLRGFAEVRKRLPDCALVLTGNRKAYHFDSRIDATIKELGLEEAVHFAGYIAPLDLPAVISLARVCTSMSLYEGFGLPILEAMARNTPVVVSDIKPYREVALDAVIKVSPGDIAQLADALYTVFVDTRLRKELSLRGKERVRLFLREQLAQTTLRVYQAIF